MPNYLRKENIEETRAGDKIRALMNFRCGNLEEVNKYWLKEEERQCIFCRKGMDCLEHHLEECSTTKGWFEEIEKNKEEVRKWLGNENLDLDKADILKKL